MINNNTQIIEKLKQSYLGLNSNTYPKFIKKVKKKDVEFESRIVINKDWNELSNKRIDLIIVADNPGEKENEEDIYLSPNAPAGKAGRIFIQQYFDLHRKKGQFLVLNKTPYWSNKSSTINDTSCLIIKKSVNLTFKAIENFWEKNKDLKILILGFDKGSIMNKYFFECYNQCENEIFKKAFHFGKHPSYGHLGSQLASALVSELKTKRRIKSNRVLKRIKDLNKEKIQNDYNIKIY